VALGAIVVIVVVIGSLASAGGRGPQLSRKLAVISEHLVIASSARILIGWKIVLFSRRKLRL
jgi:hypothetical protein